MAFYKSKYTGIEIDQRLAQATYDDAVLAGFEGSKEEFDAILGKLKEIADKAENSIQMESENLDTFNKNVVDAINELHRELQAKPDEQDVIDQGELEVFKDEIAATQTALNLKQNATDNSLNTTNKTVVGAINELKSSVDDIEVSGDVQTAISQLDFSEVTASAGNMIGTVSQTDGVINVSTRAITADDIPALAISKVTDLQTELDSKQDTLTAGTGIEITPENQINVTLDTNVFFVAEIVPESPSEDQKKKICLVPADTTEEGNSYTEYVWVVDDTHPDGYWEEFGTYKSEVDLTPYLKTEDAANTYLSKTDAASTYQPVGDYATTTALTEGLATKQNSTDDTLETTSKNIVGAINEVHDELGTKQETLVSGTNIKTVNGTSLLGSGNISTYSPARLDVSTLFADSATITSGLSSQIASYGESSAKDFPLMYAGATIGNIKPTWIRTSDAGVTNFMCIADNKIWYFEIEGTTVQRASLAIS